MKSTPRFLHASSLLCLPLAAALAGCGGDDEPAPGPSPTTPGRERPSPEVTADTLRRERVAVRFAKLEYAEALEELMPLLDRAMPDPMDHVRRAQIALRQGELDEALAAASAARAIDPDLPAMLYTFGRIELLGGDPEAAVAHFERVLELVPDDPATKVGLAEALYFSEDGEEDEVVDRIRGLLEEVAALGIEDGLQWYVTAVYKRFRLSLDMDEPEEVQRTWTSLWNFQEEQGYEAASPTQLDPGDLARVEPPVPAGSFPDGEPSIPELGKPRVLATLDAAPELFAMHDMDGDRLLDIVTLTDGRVEVHTRGAGAIAPVRSAVALEGVSGPLRVFDLNQRAGGDTLDIVAVRGTRLVVAEQSDDIGETSWAPSPVELPDLGGAIVDFEPVDFDHDGDLDLFCVGAFGAKLLRNDGAGLLLSAEGEALPRGSWEDASEMARLPSHPLSWCDVEDMDGDNDVDLLAGGEGRAHLFDSLRRGGFRDIGGEVFRGRSLPRQPEVADMDGDARPDLFVPGTEGSTLLLRQPSGLFEERELPAARVPAGATVVDTDLDFDGGVDVLWSVPGAHAAGAFGVAEGAPAIGEVGAGGPFDVGSGLVVKEVDGPVRGAPIALDVVRLRGKEIVAASPDPGALGNALYLKFIGVKDNRQAVGAIVEARAGAVYRRIYLRGGAVTIGIGAAEEADVVRITWPNGAVGQDLGIPRGFDFLMDDTAFSEQPEILIGSCPFLYTWNGEAFEFISDVIGITPLGLPMAPGMLVPPDHDEYVLVRGDQLRPDADGRLTVQFTEELREVTYLDRVRLDVVDHPRGTSIYPNERFKFPPFPEAHTHVVEKVARVQRATGSDGRDWTAELQREDFRHPRPFERLSGQYLGLAEPHFLELEFDPRDLEDATRIRLVATGWFYWSDASVNMAAALTPGVEFVPPTLSVPGPDGTWVPAGPPIGFPAGKTKTMVVDITDMIRREDPRLRIGSTLELYWDRIELATCDDDAPLRTHRLEPESARLYSRGFSAPVIPARPDMPLFFDWNVVTPRPRWNQHPGMYTRYGETVPLLGDIDDRYVIMGSGDALEIRFDGSELPPVPDGYVRDYLVFLDGWAKDRDPNTHEALYVEPLPFHGMSGYPYGEDESFPDTPEHRAWRREWNTRPAHGWIVPLSPAREKEWLEAELEGL